MLRSPAFTERAQRQDPGTSQQKRGRFGNEIEGEVIGDKILPSELRGKASVLTARRREVQAIDVQVVECEQGWGCRAGDHCRIVQTSAAAESLNFYVQIAVPCAG